MEFLTDTVGFAFASFLKNELFYRDFLSYLMLINAGISFLMLQYFPSPYGRYGSAEWGWPVNNKFAWLTQELPAFCLPTFMVVFTESPRLSHPVNKILMGMVFLHYLQRTFVYPLLIKGGKPTPLVSYVLALLFCAENGYLQGRTITHFASYPQNWLLDIRFITGVVLFFVGMGINLHSDHILRNLRKPGETGYKIPTGGMFEYVSGGNFFGEIVEWFGYALAGWNLPSLAFAVFTFSNLVPRAMQHHRWYKQKFEDYPSHRKVVIPFLY